MDTSDLTSATMIVTGGNTGIGLETAVGLAGRGAHVVITARDPQRGAAGVTAIRHRTGSDRVDVLPLDLASFESIRSFVTAFLDRYDRLDVLINNAGLAPDGRRWETAEGFEAAFGVNHLGYALLTRLLIDRLRDRAPSRIVVVSSGALPHGRGRSASTTSSTWGSSTP
jgi:NAD(P)-dependent dehydrogenase (short-subunit alcohol dehydrogenase family)